MDVLVHAGPREFARKAARYASFVPALPRAAGWRLSRLSRNTVDGLVDQLRLAYGFGFLSIGVVPAQVPSELDQLLALLEERSAKTILEIGTANGGTLFLFCRVAEPGGTVLSLDLPPELGGYARGREALYRSFARGGQRLELLRGDSRDEATRAKVGALLAGRPLDFLFIDGDHRYEGVRRDFELYSGLVRPGGMIALHDIVPGPGDLVGGVPRFWGELRGSGGHEVRELVGSWEQGGYGIGVVLVPEATTPGGAAETD